MERLFRDRAEAARTLAPLLTRYEGRKDAVVVAIPRGGLVVGRIVADMLGLPLDVALTKKIGLPGEPELAIGAVSLEAEAFDEDALRRFGVPRDYLRREADRLRVQLRERERAYRRAAYAVPLKGKTAVIVDDGIATGLTIAAAARLARKAGAKRVVVAAPVAPASSIPALEKVADEVVCVLAPETFGAIGEFYDDFDQVCDEEAVRLLASQPARSLRKEAL